jgi:hypothetical protein
MGKVLRNSRRINNSGDAIVWMRRDYAVNSKRVGGSWSNGVTGNWGTGKTSNIQHPTANSEGKARPEDRAPPTWKEGAEERFKSGEQKTESRNIGRKT